MNGCRPTVAFDSGILNRNSPRLSGRFELDLEWRGLSLLPPQSRWMPLGSPTDPRSAGVIRLQTSAVPSCAGAHRRSVGVDDVSGAHVAERQPACSQQAGPCSCVTPPESLCDHSIGGCALLGRTNRWLS